MNSIQNYSINFQGGKNNRLHKIKCPYINDSIITPSIEHITPAKIEKLPLNKKKLAQEVQQIEKYVKAHPEDIEARKLLDYASSLL